MELDSLNKNVFRVRSALQRIRNMANSTLVIESDQMETKNSICREANGAEILYVLTILAYIMIKYGAQVIFSLYEACG